MNNQSLNISEAYSLSRSQFSVLFKVLKDRGFEVYGPKLRNRAIVIDHIASIDDFPIGWTDIQDAASYRVEQRNDDLLFSYNAGANSWKAYLFPPQHTAMKTRRVDGKLTIESGDEPLEKLAFFGIKPCELAAIHIQDKTFLEGPFIDSYYRSRRKRLLTVVTNCTKAGGTCFCASMGTGPEARDGFDLSLTEIKEGTNHSFVIKAGSALGLEILNALPVSPAPPDLLKSEAKLLSATAKSMGRHLDTTDIVNRVYSHMESPHWDDVASRCLSCGNCTMVCPTCFCFDAEEHSSLDGTSTERLRLWDSCFSLQHSYLHGGFVRRHLRSRYRQWLSHKLAGWHEQFGVSGCVGCGRCITWCPVGIDITAEYAALTEESTPKTKKRTRAEAR